MNSTFKFKLIQALNKKNGNKGFTLIELLVVVIIIGVLAAIALPNLLNQVAKGRQAEARNNLGVLNRAQQAYRLENPVFGKFSTSEADNQLPITVTQTYYTYPNVTTVDAFGAQHTATAQSNYTNDIRDYDSAVGQTSSGAFSAVICEQIANPSATVAAGSLATAGTSGNSAVCTGDGKTIQ
jgi:type IV pilus assembly protein PilA